MNNFERIKCMSIDELISWIDMHCNMNDAPWQKWFNKNYCKKCKAVKASFISDQYGGYWDGEHEFSWCELYGNCRYFQDIKKIPNRKEIIKLWLESER